MQSPYGNVWSSSAATWLRFLGRHVALLLFLLLAFGGMVFVYWFFSPLNDNLVNVAVAANGSDSLIAPIYKAVPNRPVLQRLPQSQGSLRIGLVSGHLDNDSGAVCADGLTEADVNLRITQLVAEKLRGRGIRTDILAEFDPQLANYSATAFISIHADSCDYFNELATGFKVAGSSYTDSSSLSICVEQAYQAETQLPYHANTITPHMTDYHAFREIAPGTPAIIIETGFMNLDRALIHDNAEVPANGITNGILCYLNGL